MVHDVVKRLRLHRHHPELSRLLLREGTRGEPGSGRLRVEILVRFIGAVVDLLVAPGVDVVGFSGPSEDRGPPVGRRGTCWTVLVGIPVVRRRASSDP